METRSIREAIKILTQQLFEKKEWRDEQNKRAGLQLSVKEMYNRALEEATNEIAPDDCRWPE